MRNFGRGAWAVYFLLIAGLVLSLPSADAAESPVSYKQLTVNYVVHADGTYIETTHAEVQANTADVARQIAQMPIDYSETNDELALVEAYTQKADGTKLPVDPGAVTVRQFKGAADVPLFNTHHQKIIPFPDVASGDTIVWTINKVHKRADLPGQFMIAGFYPRVVSYRDAQLTIQAPKSLPLNVEVHGVASEKEEQGDVVVYRLHYTAPDALERDPAAISAYDRLPRFFVSTFGNYDELGHAYAALANDRISATPQMHEYAGRIAGNVTDRREQARLLYEWVTTHIAYVAMQLGDDATAHTTNAVLASHAGNSQDQAVLLASLLKAEGIESEPVLVNAGNSYTLAQVPTLAQLDHVILWLPEFSVYVDTTMSTAQFGILLPEEYGKQAVHAVTTGRTMRSIPVLAPGVAKVALKTVERLSEDGEIVGTSVTAAAGPFSTSLRRMALAFKSMGAAHTASAELASLGTRGVGNFEIEPGDRLTADSTITGKFQLDPNPGLLSGAGFTIPAGLRLLPRPGEVLMGPLTLADLKTTEPTPCYSGTETEDLTLELPPNRGVATLPKDMQIKTDHLQYTTHWAKSDKAVSVHREFVSVIDQPLCTGKIRAEAAAALEQIRMDYGSEIQLRSQ